MQIGYFTYYSMMRDCVGYQMPYKYAGTLVSESRSATKIQDLILGNFTSQPMCSS